MLTVCLLVLMAALSVVHVDGYTYLALFPRNISPTSTVKVPVHFSGPVVGETIRLTLSRVYHDGRVPAEPIIAERTHIVPNGANKADVIITTPPDIQYGSYNLNITGSGPVKFFNHSTVYGRPKAHAIFIQTDKKMYKPGDNVQYRVFSVFSDLSLAAPVFDVAIYDPKNNKLDALNNQRNYYGINGTFELADPTSIGTWRIEVNILSGARESTESQSQHFEVAEYVLPKYEVSVDLPPFAMITDTVLTGTASAKYTFGKPVVGTLVVIARKRYTSSLFYVAGLTKTITQFDGTATFSFDVKDLKRLTYNLKYETIVVTARVTETTTGITQEGEGSISYQEESNSVNFYENLPDHFLSNVNPYSVLVKVSQQNDRPLEPPFESLKITETFFTETKLSPPQTPLSYLLISPFQNGDVIVREPRLVTIDPDGIARFDVVIPDGVSTGVIKAEYKDASARKELRRFRTSGTDTLKCEALNGNSQALEIGSIVTFKVTVTDLSATSVFYVIVSRGLIRENGEILLNLREGIKEVKVTRDMAPSAKFLAYYTKSDGEILANGLTFIVDDIFENKVGLNFVESSPQEPKTNVSLTVKTKANSEVFLLGVDRSVQLLASGNDITAERVRNEMGLFGDSVFVPRGWGSILPPWPLTADDPADMFYNAQMNPRTDGNVYSFNLWSLQRQNFEMVQASPRIASMSAKSFSMEDNSGGFGGGANSAPVGQVRTKFPETWIWTSVTADGFGNAEVKDYMPDTITTFTVNAFSLSSENGLGVATQAANMTTFLPFFVQLQLPPTAVRGEQVIVQANVFNYLTQDHKVRVTLAKSAGFVSVIVGDYGIEREENADIEKCINVKANSVSPVYFSIKPTTIGSIELRVTAFIKPPTNRFDTVVRHLPVKAEGLETEKTQSTMIVSQGNQIKRETIPISYPLDLVADSARIRVGVYGDILGPSLKNLDRLIRMPTGCGEQNMINFAPSVFAAAYLQSTGRLDPIQQAELIDRLTRILRIGYQRQLLYQRHDGAFSAFGNADDEGSLWLTCFVAKSFAQAKSINLITIEPQVVEKALNFIIDARKDMNGFVINIGAISSHGLQGSTASSTFALTCYVLTSLLEVKDAEIIANPITLNRLNVEINQLTDALRTYINNNPTTGLSDYELAIAAYAFVMAKDALQTYSQLMNRLENSNVYVKEGSMAYWNVSSPSDRIEIAGYALLTYTAMKALLPQSQQLTTKGSQVTLYLVKQRGSYGGFRSTQDTVIALQALTSFATSIYEVVKPGDINMSLDICTSTNNIDSAKQTVVLTSANQDQLHLVDFPNGMVDNVKIEAKGPGTALVTITQMYNIHQESSPAYTLTVTTTEETLNSYTINVCATFTEPDQLTSNMAVLDIAPISGFAIDMEAVGSIPLLKRKELTEAGRLVLYFDEIPKRLPLCIDVPIYRSTIVARVKSASVLVYSYYEPTEQRVMVNYLPASLKDKSQCSICPSCCSINTSCTGRQG